MINIIEKKITSVGELGKNGNDHFWYLMSKTGLIGISVLTKPDVKKYTSLGNSKDTDDFIRSRLILEAVYPESGYWPAQYVQHFENTPTEEKHIILQSTVGQKAYGIDRQTLSLRDFWSLIKKSSDNKTWEINEAVGVTRLRKRNPADIKKIGAILQKSFIHGQANSVLAKVHKGNGRILLKVSSSFSLE